jgi:anti-sigma factor (TIGR02949 family)
MAHDHDKENCRYLLASLSEYVDGTLGASLCEELERHLAGCQDCRVVVDTLKKTVYLVRNSAPSPDLPDEVRARLYHKLDLDEFLKKS